MCETLNITFNSIKENGDCFCTNEAGEVETFALKKLALQPDEVAVIIHTATGEYYAEKFKRDWIEIRSKASGD